MLSDGQGIDSIDEALRRHRQQGAAAGGPVAQADLSTQALAVVLDCLSQYSDDQLAAMYDNMLGEIASRGLEEEITGEVVDAAGISLDDEMNELIKMVRRMRNNLNTLTATGKAVSNREIRETLTATITAVKALASHQKSIRTLERQRNLENTLIELLGEMDEAMQEEFKRRFRERLEEYQE